MQNKNLERSKRKLTLTFTVIITLITVFVGIVSFSGKFANEYRKDHEAFDLMAQKVHESKTKGITQIFDFIERKPELFKGRKEELKDRLNTMLPGNIIIFKNNELVKYKFIEKFSEHSIDDILRLSGHSKSVIDGVVNIKFTSGNYDIFVFKKLKYDLSDYFFDIITYILVVVLLSVGFYYIGFRFVSKVLKPVEDNMRDMNDFVHNAGHELKTPISIISSNLQLIKETKNYDKELIKEGLIEINRLNHLIESLVELSNISENIESEKLNLEEEIKIIIKDFKVEADAKELDIKLFKDRKSVV